MVLYVARQDDVARHHGGVFRVQESVFAPPEAILAVMAVVSQSGLAGSVAVSYRT